MDPELRARWSTPDGRVLAEEAIARLMAGRSLDDMRLGEVDGRTDLRALPAPVPRRLKRFEVDRWFVDKLGDLITFRGVELRGIDLSDAFLDSFRIHDCVIEDCVLDTARCHDWRMWNTRVRNSSFRHADLRQSALGPWKSGKGNAYEKVSFIGADFRDCAWITAIFTDCDFADAKLDRVQFLRSGVTRCKFQGHMQETVFDGRVFDTAEESPNYAEDVDMSNAELRLVEFREFNLPAVKLPDSPDLHVIPDYPCVLRAAIDILSNNSDDETGRVLLAMLHGQQKGSGRGYPFGLFNRRDYQLLGGPEMAALAEDVMLRAERECANSNTSSRSAGQSEPGDRSERERNSPGRIVSLLRGSRKQGLSGRVHDTAERLLRSRWCLYLADGAWQRRESYGLCRCDCEHGGDAHPRQPNCFFVSAERFVGTGVRGQEPLRGHAATASCAPGLQKREDAQISPAMVIPRPPWRLASPWCVGFAARIVMSDTNNSRQLCEKPADPQQVAEIATSCARIRGSGWLRCSRDLRGSALRF